MVRISGACESWAVWGSGLGHAAGGGVGAGRALDRGVSGQYLYGDASNRSGRVFDRASSEMETPPVATGPALVAALVHQAALRASLKR